MKSVVYIDILFLINFLMDTVIVYASSLILKRDIHILRLALSAALMAAYSAAMFFPQLSVMYSLLFKIAFMPLTVAAAFPTRSPRQLLKNTAVFCGVCALFGGISFLLIFATDFGTAVGAAVSNGEIYIAWDFPQLAAAAAAAYAAVFAVSYVNTRCRARAKYIYNVSVSLGEKSVRLRALLDTGCAAEDIFGAPALIINRNCAKELLPYGFPHSAAFSDRYRALPYKTVGQNTGIMHAFVPDLVLIGCKETKKCVVGISEVSLSEGKDFDAIFNPVLLDEQNITERNGKNAEKQSSLNQEQTLFDKK